MSPGPVTVIDIGSNSIKVLVATRSADGQLATLHQRTIDARISAGIGQATPVLGEDGMARGVVAIQALLAESLPFSPRQTILVATSAVRDASNGSEFRARVRASTGHDIRILSGEEEANLIGGGLVCDPALRQLQDFYVFDLGGGSLECLAFHQRRIQQAASLPLGSVRLMEMFLANRSAAVSRAEAEAVVEHVKAALRSAGFRFSLPPTAVAIGTGGGMTTARAILGARENKSVEATPSQLSVEQLRELLALLASRDLSQRQQVPGLSAARADLMPVALLTFLTLADGGGFSGFRHSLYNLRYGLAAEVLAAT